MPPRRLALPVLLLLACGTSPSDDDATTDVPVTTSESSAGPDDTTAPDASTSGDASTSDADPTTTAAASTTDPDPTTTAAASTTDPDPSTSTSGSTGDDTTSGDETTGDVVEELPPIDGADVLEAWLAEGKYKNWAVESGVHASTGPHGGNVLTYVNAIALQSLADGNAEHPQDAATVKELYGDSFDTIIGYAVSRKTAAQSMGGETWYWYERVNDTTYGDGLGVALCYGCHGGGADYILTPYPLQ